MNMLNQFRFVFRISFINAKEQKLYGVLSIYKEDVSLGQCLVEINDSSVALTPFYEQDGLPVALSDKKINDAAVQYLNIYRAAYFQRQSSLIVTL